jgi:hypothetical protein
MQQLEDGFTLRAIVRQLPRFLRNHLQCIGLPAGSELVTAAFERNFLERFRQTGLPETTEVLYRARRAFDLRKMAVGDVDEDKFWECPANGLKRDQPNKFTDGGMLFTR